MHDLAYQGVPGAFSEEAAIAFAPSASRVAVPQFRDVFDAVERGDAHLGVVPIENTLAGSVHAVYDLLAERDVRIAGERVLRVSHALVGVPGASVEALRRVYSHPVALAQCEAFFRAHPQIEPVAAYNTAGAIADVVSRGAADEAAIGSRRAAERYGGAVLLAPLEDDPENYTRFLLIARPDEPPREGAVRKTSLMFRLAHRPGSLREALSVFADRGLDLSKIESRPLKGRPFEYAFHADVVSKDDAAVQGAIAALASVAHDVRVFGTYPAA